ncbi:MAG: glycerate kinase [Lactobacillaceae bacterium]|jgi:glycerate kinase|nr:glycerate kinase [Lactobacillaceae bacterium]
MKFVIAPDSFKGGMTAKQAAIAIETGLKRVFPTAEYVQVPMADGGEGTVQSLVDATNGEFQSAQVLNPLGDTVTATYGILGDKTTAVIEMAAASGIQYVDEQTKNPLITTTYGTGQLIIAALDQDIRHIILGVGGSATNDGGAGMAQALGVELLDENHEALPFGGGALDQLAYIELANIDPRLAETTIQIASDVTNPLVGDTGASAVFGPQKGATPAMVAQLDANLQHYATIIERDLGKSIANTPGAGAAGGLGGGLLAFTNSKLKPGIEIVVEATGLSEKARDADYVFTGEGSIDFQTQYGKTPMGTAQAVKKVNPQAKVIGVAGNVGEGIDQLYALGIDAVFSTTPGIISLATALEHDQFNLSRLVENIARLLK